MLDWFDLMRKKAHRSFQKHILHKPRWDLGVMMHTGHFSYFVLVFIEGHAIYAWIAGGLALITVISFIIGEMVD